MAHLLSLRLKRQLRTKGRSTVSSDIKKAGNKNRTVDEIELASSAIEKAGSAKRGDDAYLIIEKEDCNKRTVADELINTPIQKAGADLVIMLNGPVSAQENS